MSATQAGLSRNTVPSGYGHGQVGNSEIVARIDVFEEVLRALEHHGSLYEWAAHQPQQRILSGRARVFVATFPISGLRVAVRHVWHGGLLAPVTRDLFSAPTRAPQELSNSLRLSALGIRSSTIIGFSLTRALLSLRRVDVMSIYIADAIDLGELISAREVDFTSQQVVQSVATLLNRLHLAGVLHPDLNARNILLSKEADEVRATLIDVDVVGFPGPGTAQHVGRDNSERLARSIRKITGSSPSSVQPHRSDLVASLLEVCEQYV